MLAWDWLDEALKHRHFPVITRGSYRMLATCMFMSMQAANFMLS